MYIIKNAYLNIIRSKGRNILIGIIIMAITIGACIAITINKSGNNLVSTYHDNNPLEVTLNLDSMSYRNATDEEKEAFNLITVDDINNIGSLSMVDGYYYTLQSNLNSDDIEAVSYDELFKKPSEQENDSEDSNRPNKFSGGNMNMSSGDFSIVAYSDISYNEDFINGNKKLLEGSLIEADNTDNVIVISEELATNNDLSVGDSITFTNTNDESISYTYEIVGIYEIVTDSSTTNPIGKMMNNESNQIISNLTVLNQIINDDGTDTTSYSMSSSITSAFYMDYEDQSEFESAVRELGISEYYKISTNESEITSTLEPIKNITSFSFTFLIVILIVGGVVLAIINLFNIRERKYEIGVLRAIGMTKAKVTLELVSEILMIALIALIIGTSAGSLLSQPVSNYMLKNEINSYKESQNNITENFGSGNFSAPGFGNFNPSDMPNKGNKDQATINTENFVSSLTVHTDFMTILQLFGISLALTIISGMVAVMFINKYEPNKILQNRG